MKLRPLVLGAFGLAAFAGLREASPSAGAPLPPPAAAQDQAAARFTKDVVPFLTKHCFACHGNGKKRGDVSLEGYRDVQAVQKDRQVWENVLHMLRAGDMPPQERPRPTATEVEAALRALDAVLARGDCTGPGNPGRVTLRRLNRVEYNNTIRDLIGVDFQPAADFPNDDVGYGFDNIGDVLSLSPLLLEKYLAAAESILEQAIVTADPPQPVKTPLGGLRPPRGAGGTRRGFGTFLHSQGDIVAEGYCDAGDYVIRVEAFGQQVGDEPVRATVRVGDVKKEFDVSAKQSAPAILEMKVKLPAGTRRVAVSFLNPYTDPNVTDKDKQRRLLVVRGIVLDGPYNAPPPTLPESHKRIMGTPQATVSLGEGGQGKGARETARAIVTRFATAAFRRPLKPEEVERLLSLYDKASQKGERCENAVRLSLCGVLVSPHFLFRVELDPPGARPGTPYLVNEYELASRLSYFLWSSMPDEKLFASAAKGELRKNLEPQVRRMLEDPKSAAFVRNFAGQWLTLGKLSTIAPDPRRFPGFDEELRSAMYRETELFFDAILREDRRILDLLDADFSFVNERLAKHYGIAGVTGKEFRRVKLPVNRGGLLTHASILTLTSNSTRTAPVKRGKFVLDQILNTPPPPPPPDVPNLPEDKELTGSLRQVMEMHRENALCASCHQRMDPIGFAFENYDAIGGWRDRDGKFPIDPTGVLPGGKSFKGPAELKAIIKSKKDLFSRCLTEKILTYALGRGLEHYDRCAVDKVLEALDKNDYRFSILLMEVIKSVPFQMRTATGGKQ
jgi:hypothetical protein